MQKEFAILKFENRYDRQEAEKKLKEYGIPSKNISKSVVSSAFKYRYELNVRLT